MGITYFSPCNSYQLLRRRCYLPLRGSSDPHEVHLNPGLFGEIVTLSQTRSARPYKREPLSSCVVSEAAAEPFSQLKVSYVMVTCFLSDIANTEEKEEGEERQRKNKYRRQKLLAFFKGMRVKKCRKLGLYIVYVCP